MSEKPILFSAPMVRAILAGTKTQTRRLIKASRPKHVAILANNGKPYQIHHDEVGENEPMGSGEPMPCPYGEPGDRLWVRETWMDRPNGAGVELRGPDDIGAIYRATWDRSYGGRSWRSPIYMPRWASRITLEVTGVRVERLQAISEEDARAEGVRCHICDGPVDGTSENDCACFHSRSEAVRSFEGLWDSINGKRADWASNPLVWVISFRRIEQVVARDVAG